MVLMMCSPKALLRIFVFNSDASFFSFLLPLIIVQCVNSNKAVLMMCSHELQCCAVTVVHVSPLIDLLLVTSGCTVYSVDKMATFLSRT